VLVRYMTAELQPDDGRRTLAAHPGRRKGSVSTMEVVTLSDDNNRCSAAFNMGGRLTVSVTFASERPFIPVLNVTVKSVHGLAIMSANNLFVGGFSFGQRQSAGMIACTFDELPLLPGRYVIDLTLGDSFRDLDTVDDAITFEVLPADVFGTGKLPPPGSAVIFCPARFSLTNGDGSGPSPISVSSEPGS
jgi:lipopolysaccharide transport system ATP-binding protein